LNLNEVLDLYLDEPAGSNYVFPLPDNSLESNDEYISVEVDETIAFSMLLRQQRLEHRMTQKDVQNAMGLKNRNSYARLEGKGNPTLSTIRKILKVFPEFPLYEVLPFSVR